MIDFKSKSMKKWSSIVESYKYFNQLDFHEMYIPTVETEKYSYMVTLLLVNNVFPIICGEQCSGKSSIILNTLKQLKQYSHYQINFN